MDKKKTPKFMKLRHKLAVIKENIKNSIEIKAFLSMSAEILAYSFLGGMSLLVFLPVHILIKFLGVGCFIWLFERKLYPLVCGILSSLTLVRSNR